MSDDETTLPDEDAAGPSSEVEVALLLEGYLSDLEAGRPAYLSAGIAPEHALALMRHPRTVVTFSDSGAHVSQIMDASLQTHVLSHWVRARQAFTLEQAVRMLSFEPATHWGFVDRGLVREGMAADLIVFDPDTAVARAASCATRSFSAGGRRRAPPRRRRRRVWRGSWPGSRVASARAAAFAPAAGTSTASLT